jgi:hypothetical protein
VLWKEPAHEVPDLVVGFFIDDRGIEYGDVIFEGVKPENPVSGVYQQANENIPIGAAIQLHHNKENEMSPEEVDGVTEGSDASTF